MRKPRVIQGTELRRGLAVLVERMSSAARLLEAEVPDGLSPADLRARWRVSHATLTRLRALGLPARRVRDSRNRARIVVRSGVAEGFAHAHADRLARTATYSRMTQGQRDQVLRRARRYRRCLGWSLNRAALRIAQRLGRSHEAVRQVLLAHDAAHPATRTFPAGATLTARQGRVLYRAWRRGVDLGAMARKTRRSRASVRRAINLARASLLRGLIQSGALPPPGAGRSAPGALTPAPANSGLGAPAPSTLGQLLDAARVRVVPVPFEERARLAAYHALRARASAGIARLARLHPSAQHLDRIETDLLWASRLKAALIAAELRVILDSLHSRTGRDPASLDPEASADLLLAAIASAGEAIDGMDASRGGRVAAAVGLAADRLAARRPTITKPRRAQALAKPDLPIPDWTRALSPWQAWLEPDPRLRPAAAAQRPDARRAQWLQDRFGWSGGPPRSIAELAASTGVKPTRLPVLIQAAIREALAPRSDRGGPRATPTP
jgi:hypothetical protein